LGVMSYEEAARAAYVGAINANGPVISAHFIAHDLTHARISGLREAHEFLADGLARMASEPRESSPTQGEEEAKPSAETETKPNQQTPQREKGAKKTPRPNTGGGEARGAQLKHTPAWKRRGVDREILPLLSDILKPIPKQTAAIGTSLFGRRGPAPARPSVVGTTATEDHKRDLQRVLMDEFHRDTRRQLSRRHTSLEDRYTLSVTDNDTCADFLFVRMSNPSDRMHSFNTSVRLFLGLPVTANRCNMSGCEGTCIHPNGQHLYHLSGLVTKRHELLKNVLAELLEKLATSRKCRYTSEREVSMEALGYRKREGAKTGWDRADIVLTNNETGHHFVLDVMVTYPTFGEESARDSRAAVNRGHKVKMNKYCGPYEIDPADVMPIVFDTYGGYAPQTLGHLTQIAQVLGGNDEEESGKILRYIRDKIAVALHRGHTRVIRQFNSLNCAHEYASKTGAREMSNKVGQGTKTKTIKRKQWVSPIVRKRLVKLRTKGARTRRGEGEKSYKAN
jgi:hypothetical protein